MRMSKTRTKRMSSDFDRSTEVRDVIMKESVQYVFRRLYTQCEPQSQQRGWRPTNDVVGKRARRSANVV